MDGKSAKYTRLSLPAEQLSLVLRHVNAKSPGQISSRSVWRSPEEQTKLITTLLLWWWSCSPSQVEAPSCRPTTDRVPGVSPGIIHYIIISISIPYLAEMSEWRLGLFSSGAPLPPLVHPPMHALPGHKDNPIPQYCSADWLTAGWFTLEAPQTRQVSLTRPRGLPSAVPVSNRWWCRCCRWFRGRRWRRAIINEW